MPKPNNTDIGKRREGMTTEEFWEKWEPCDWPAIAPDNKTKNEFILDLERVIKERLDKLDKSNAQTQEK